MSAPSSVRYLADTEDILCEIKSLIERAEQHIVLQMYLFARNGDLSVLLPRERAARHAELVAHWLLDKRRRAPEIPIVLILDSNTPADAVLTRARRPPLRAELEAQGITVLHANLFYNEFDRRPRRSVQRNFHIDWRSTPAKEWVRRQARWQTRHNLEDHRKNLVIDAGRAGLVTSHNLVDMAHDWYENAFALEGRAARDLWRSTRRALSRALELPYETSPETLRLLAERVGPEPEVEPPAGDTVWLLDSLAIRPALTRLVSEAAAGDELLLASAYFSDLRLFEELARACQRGVRVKVLIDDVAGLPVPEPLGWGLRNLVNCEVLGAAARRRAELPGLELRVHHSGTGRLMHLKSALRQGRENVLIGGQANFTPNSFSGAWLETDVETRCPRTIAAFREHFLRLWALPESRPCPEFSAAERVRATLRRASLAAFRRFGLEP